MCLRIVLDKSVDLEGSRILSVCNLCFIYSFLKDTVASLGKSICVVYLLLYFRSATHARPSKQQLKQHAPSEKKKKKKAVKQLSAIDLHVGLVLQRVK